MPAIRNGAPAWACEWLRKAGYTTHTEMGVHITRWWGWYTCQNPWYAAADVRDARDDRHMTIHPARTVCDEWASLLTTDGTFVSSEDEAVNEWLQDDFVQNQSDLVSRMFALGTAAWAVDVCGAVEGGASASAYAALRGYDAGGIIPLDGMQAPECASCAFTRRVAVGGVEYDQLQVHEPVGGQYVISTWLFRPGRYVAPVAVEGIAPVYLTGSALPTFAIATPAIANTLEDFTPMGVSVFDCGVDSLKAVDEAFDLLYWSMRLGKTRMMVDETALERDPETGEPKGLATVDRHLYHPMQGGIEKAFPVTVYNPELRADSIARDLDLALSVLSHKCGFGRAYFSFDGHSGIKTATEVSADNSQLFRNVRRHENVLGAAIERALTGAYAAELAARTGRFVAEVPPVEVHWDDSIVTDSAADRAMMKDDIARGLCPAWMYPVEYYGMGEAEARAMTGEADPSVPLEA